MSMMLRRRGVLARRRSPIIPVQEITATGSGTAPAATFGATPSSGNLLTGVIATRGNNSLAQITNPTGWTTVAEIRLGTSQAVRIIRRISDGTESGAQTAALANSIQWGMQLWEHSSSTGWPATPEDQTHAETTGSVTTFTLGPTGTTAAAVELAVGAVALDDTTTGQNMGSGWTTESMFNRAFAGTIVLSAIGAVSTDPSWTTARSAAGVLATFRPN